MLHPPTGQITDAHSIQNLPPSFNREWESHSDSPGAGVPDNQLCYVHGPNQQGDDPKSQPYDGRCVR